MELSELNGIGKARLKALESAGIFSCEDFIAYTPRKYYNFLCPAEYVNDGAYKMIRARALDSVKVARVKKNFSFSSVKMEDSFGNVFTCLWYNQPYIKNSIKPNEEYFVYGKDNKKRKNTLVVSYFKHTDKTDGLSFFPIYKSIEGLSSGVIRHAMEDALLNTHISSCMSEGVHEAFEMMEINEAYKQIHAPSSLIALTEAKARVSIENLVPVVYAGSNQRKIGRDDRVRKYEHLDELFESYKKLLPFELTPSQNIVISDIISDLKSGMNMNRLLEGDVGAGKTAVAMFCLYVAAKCGYQSVIMAPTEILARQHFELITRLFGSDFGIKVVYLSSSMSVAEKRNATSLISSGMANIIVGSHSVFSKGVCYQNLALAVIDEQHKFGVKARASLLGKGASVDTLTMSATPIPRSLALALEGSLDISILESRPHALSVQTNIVSYGKVDDMWNYINEKLNAGSKAFVVCPKIDDSEDDGILDSSSAVSVADFLKTKLDSKVVLVHGKMKRDESEKLIAEFKNGEARCLVATTIVEVGVDAKDADIMVIENAGNFGLASLHQLRGRVGRDGRDAMCFCVVPNDISKNALDRLRFFKNNTNGFRIAEYDLESRGAGNLEGTEQHGFDSNDFSGVSVEQFELAKRIVMYMQAHGEKLFVSDETYEKLVSSIAGIVAMN